MGLAAVLRGLWDVAKFPVGVPLGVIVAVGIYVWINPAAGRAAQEAVKELVAGAELEAARATAEAERMLRRAAERRAARATEAEETLRKQAQAADLEKQDLEDEIAELRLAPVPDGCGLPDAVWRGLRNR